MIKNESNAMSHFGIVWVDIGKKPELAERFWCQGQPGCLPFFVGDRQIEDGAPVDFDEFMLVSGLLHDWPETPAGGTAVDESVRIEQLGKLRDGFGFVDTDGLVVGVAHRVRLEYGNEPSCRMLRNGRSLFPDNAEIASDLAMDLGDILSSTRWPGQKPIRKPGKSCWY